MRSDVPTPDPTARPSSLSSKPTTDPTALPSESPVSLRTMTPTVLPTPEPTPEPTLEPSMSALSNTFKDSSIPGTSVQVSAIIIVAVVAVLSLCLCCVLARRCGLLGSSEGGGEGAGGGGVFGEMFKKRNAYGRWVEWQDKRKTGEEASDILTIVPTSFGAGASGNGGGVELGARRGTVTAFGSADSEAARQGHLPSIGTQFVATSNYAQTMVYSDAIPTGSSVEASRRGIGSVFGNVNPLAARLDPGAMPSPLPPPPPPRSPAGAPQGAAAGRRQGSVVARMARGPEGSGSPTANPLHSHRPVSHGKEEGLGAQLRHESVIEGVEEGEEDEEGGEDEEEGSADRYDPSLRSL